MDANRKTALRVPDLMEAVPREPYAGLGKPEHLKHLGGTVWSRRINEAERVRRAPGGKAGEARFHGFRRWLREATAALAPTINETGSVRVRLGGISP